VAGESLAEKILARSCRRSVSPGEYVEASVDLAMFHELTGPLTLKVLRKLGSDKPWDREKLVIVLDHQVPADTVKTAELHKELRIYARRWRIPYFYDVGRHGIAHQLLVEEGFVQPGMLIVGADSHTCTAGALGAFATGVGSTDMAAVVATGKIWLRVPESMKITVDGELPKGVYAKDVVLHVIGEIGADGATYMAVEFHGSTIESMSISDRLTICNMAVEMGAKTGMVNSDARTLEYLRSIGCELRYPVLRSDDNAHYAEELHIDASKLEPVVACPHRVDNVKAVAEVEGTPVDQVFIGSCTNGRIEDLRVAAKILKGRKVAEGTRLIVIPASQRVLKEALREELIDIFVDAGGVVCNPNCGPCLGGHMGVLADGEVAISTSNRNFIGRMGSPKSEVYLASPATAAASAVEGRITDPRRYLP